MFLAHMTLIASQSPWLAVTLNDLWRGRGILESVRTSLPPPRIKAGRWDCPVS